MRRIWVTLTAAFLSCLTVGFVTGLSGGCDANGRLDVDRLQSELRATTRATTQRVAEARAEIDKLPPDSPDREILETNLAKVTAALAKADEVLRKGDAVVEAVQNGNLQPLVNATNGIPYAGLVITLGGLGWAWWKKNQHAGDANAAITALGQVVKSVEAAMPDKSDAVKRAMNEVQDSQTRLLVERIKSGL
jgi:predicted negative regulator of RcsB-dependent stress response